MPIPEHQDIEALEEEFFFNYLPSNFPKEFGELCLIPPLDKNKDLIRTVQLSLGEIIFRHRKRFAEDKDYFVRIEKCIRSAESAEKALQEFVDLFMRMDAAHRDAILYVANEIASDQFQDQKLGEFFGELTAMATMMRVLAAAVMYGTGISAARRGQGRPQSPYTSPAFELMQQWQSITAEPMTTGEALTLFEPIEPIDDLTPAEQRAIRRINTPFDGTQKSIQCLRLDHWARARTKTRSDNT